MASVLLWSRVLCFSRRCCCGALRLQLVNGSLLRTSCGGAPSTYDPVLLPVKSASGTVGLIASGHEPPLIASWQMGLSASKSSAGSAAAAAAATAVGRNVVRKGATSGAVVAGGSVVDTAQSHTDTATHPAFSSPSSSSSCSSLGDSGIAFADAGGSAVPVAYAAATAATHQRSGSFENIHIEFGGVDADARLAQVEEGRRQQRLRRMVSLTSQQQATVQAGSAAPPAFLARQRLQLIWEGEGSVMVLDDAMHVKLQEAFREALAVRCVLVLVPSCGRDVYGFLHVWEVLSLSLCCFRYCARWWCWCWCWCWCW